MKKNNNSEILLKLRKAFERSTPDVLDSVLTDCMSEKGRIITMTERKNTIRFTRRIIAAAACFVLLFASFGGLAIYKNHYTVATTVSLDVNPSLEIKVNEQEKVLEVVPLNDDALDVIGNMDFNGSSVELTVNALIGSMLTKGYINDITNSVLVSVESEGDSTSIRDKVKNEIASFINSDNIKGAVITQVINSDKELKALAEEYGISMGKAQLIKTIITTRPEETFEGLAPLTVTELCLILGEDSFTDVNNSIDIEVGGNTKENLYVGKDAALNTALEKYELTSEQIKEVDVTLDVWDGTIIYVVKFKVETASSLSKYVVRINAVTGYWIGGSLQTSNGPVQTQVPSDNVPTGHITPTEAVKIARERLGIASTEGTASVELGHIGGNYAWGVEITVNYDVYFVEIYSASGKIASITCNGENVQ